MDPISRRNVLTAAAGTLATAVTVAGAQAGETRIREVVTSAGFNRFRRATETPFNIVYEARP